MHYQQNTPPSNGVAIKMPVLSNMSLYCKIRELRVSEILQALNKSKYSPISQDKILFFRKILSQKAGIRREAKSGGDPAGGWMRVE